MCKVFVVAPFFITYYWNLILVVNCLECPWRHFQFSHNWSKSLLHIFHFSWQLSVSLAPFSVRITIVQSVPDSTFSSVVNCSGSQPSVIFISVDSCSKPPWRYFFSSAYNCTLYRVSPSPFLFQLTIVQSLRLNAISMLIDNCSVSLAPFLNHLEFFRHILLKLRRKLARAEMERKCPPWFWCDSCVLGDFPTPGGGRGRGWGEGGGGKCCLRTSVQPEKPVYASYCVSSFIVKHLGHSFRLYIPRIFWYEKLFLYIHLSHNIVWNIRKSFPTPRRFSYENSKRHCTGSTNLVVYLCICLTRTGKWL